MTSLSTTLSISFTKTSTVLGLKKHARLDLAVWRRNFYRPVFLQVNNASEGGFVVVEDDIQALLQILPLDLQHCLQNNPRRDQLLEVVLDLGRRPEARFVGEPGGKFLRNTEISLSELEEAQKAVGEFGSGNRAGIEGTLHRVSAIRSRKGLIVGLTCRVGRAVSGHVDMVRDLLQYRESILFLGRPGVGKTTVMREIARVLADELQKRVDRLWLTRAMRLVGMGMFLMLLLEVQGECKYQNHPCNIELWSKLWRTICLK